LKETADIPVFGEVDDALHALSWSLGHFRHQAGKATSGSWSLPVKKKGPPGSSVIMGAGETFRLLAGRGLPVAPYVVVDSAEAAVSAAERIGFPVAVKLASPNVLHKTEKGGVALDLTDGAAVKRAIGGMEGERHLVQKMAPFGYEAMVGGKRDEEFGPVVVFGLGGIFVELLDDTAIRVAPVTAEMAREMIAEVKGAAIMRGFRGKPPADTDALAAVIVAVSNLLAADTAIRNIDINPVIVGERGTGCMVVDAKIEVEGADSSGTGIESMEAE
jgi:succinyl-CoA synthetase beta subunit